MLLDAFRKFLIFQFYVSFSISFAVQHYTMQLRCVRKQAGTSVSACVYMPDGMKLGATKAIAANVMDVNVTKALLPSYFTLN